MDPEAGTPIHCVALLVLFCHSSALCIMLGRRRRGMCSSQHLGRSRDVRQKTCRGRCLRWPCTRMSCWLWYFQGRQKAHPMRGTFFWWFACCQTLSVFWYCLHNTIIYHHAKMLGVWQHANHHQNVPRTGCDFRLPLKYRIQQLILVHGQRRHLPRHVFARRLGFFREVDYYAFLVSAGLSS